MNPGDAEDEVVRARESMHAEALSERKTRQTRSYMECREHEETRRRSAASSDRTFAAYWATWTQSLLSAREANDKLVGFFRGLVEGGRAYASALRAAQSTVACSSHEALPGLSSTASSLDVVMHRLGAVQGVIADHMTEHCDSVGQRVLESPLVAMASGYVAQTSSIIADGDTLAERLVEADKQAEASFDAYTKHFEQLDLTPDCTLGRDSWLYELHYQRAVRVLEHVRKDYHAGMATLFENYRELEARRSSAISAAVESYVLSVQRVFVSLSVPLGEIVRTTRALATHTDFLQVVQRAKAPTSPSPEASHVGPSRDDSGRGSGGGAGGGGGGGGGSSGGGDGGGGGGGDVREGSGGTVVTDPSQAGGLRSALSSLLIVRWGILYRQSSLLKMWKPCIGVVTYDRWFHVFNMNDDLATPDDEMRRHCAPRPASASKASAPRKDPFCGLGDTRVVGDPQVSVNLIHSRTTFCASVHEAAFDIVETVPALMFFTSSKRVVLRTDDQSDMVDWMCTLSDFKEGVGQARREARKPLRIEKLPPGATTHGVVRAPQPPVSPRPAVTSPTKSDGGQPGDAPAAAAAVESPPVPAPAPEGAGQETEPEQPPTAAGASGEDKPRDDATQASTDVVGDRGDSVGGGDGDRSGAGDGGTQSGIDAHGEDEGVSRTESGTLVSGTDD